MNLYEVFNHKSYNYEIVDSNTTLKYTLEEDSINQICIFFETPGCPQGYLSCESINTSL